MAGGVEAGCEVEERIILRTVTAVFGGLRKTKVGTMLM